MASKLAFMVKWPSEDACIRTLPRVFLTKYPRCRVVIDCTEIFIEKPSSLDANSSTLSIYKHHITMKVLAGVCPIGYARPHKGQKTAISERSGNL